MTRAYAVVVRRAERNYPADCADVPGCVATGRTVDDTLRRMRSALTLHIRGLREAGLAVPRPATPLTKLARRGGREQVDSVVRVAA